MDEKLQSLVEQLKGRFGVSDYTYLDETSLIIDPAKLVETCRIMRDEYNFEMLVVETAVDYWPELKPRFHVVIRLRSLQRNLILGLRVPLEGNFPTMATLETVYPNANWFERELWDMFGIRFLGHSDLRRIVMPHDWEGHPLRKDFPLGYEEPQFSFNYDEIDLRKPYAKE